MLNEKKQGGEGFHLEKGKKKRKILLFDAIIKGGGGEKGIGFHLGR